MMIIDNCYVIAPETAEEVRLANDAILKYREEKLREQAIEKNKKSLENMVASMIEDIGLEETKHIIREISHNLRNCSEELPF